MALEGAKMVPLPQEPRPPCIPGRPHRTSTGTPPLIPNWLTLAADTRKRNNGIAGLTWRDHRSRQQPPSESSALAGDDHIVVAPVPMRDHTSHEAPTMGNSCGSASAVSRLAAARFKKGPAKTGGSLREAGLPRVDEIPTHHPCAWPRDGPREAPSAAWSDSNGAESKKCGVFDWA